MDDPLRMRIRERTRDISEESNGCSRRHRPGIEPSSERLAPNERHGIVRQTVTAPGGQKRDDVRMLETGNGAKLPLEAFCRYALGQLRRQHLDDDVAFQPNFARDKHA